MIKLHLQQILISLVVCAVFSKGVPEPKGNYRLFAHIHTMEVFFLFHFTSFYSKPFEFINLNVLIYIVNLNRYIANKRLTTKKVTLHDTTTVLIKAEGRIIKDLRGNIIQQGTQPKNLETNKKDSKYNTKSSHKTSQTSTVTYDIEITTAESVRATEKEHDTSSIRCYGCHSPSADCTVPCRFPQKCFLRSSTPQSPSKN